MDIETLRDRRFTQETLAEIRKTAGGVFKSSKNRLNVNISLVYEKQGDHPFVIDSRKCYPLNNVIDEYKRNIEIEKGETIEFDMAWLKDKAGTIFIKNITGSDMVTRPTDVIKRQISESELVVRIGDSEIPLAPGQPMYFPAPRAGLIKLSAPNYKVKVQTCVFPS